MPNLTDDEFTRQYFQYVVKIHLAQERELKRLRQENVAKPFVAPLNNMYEINRKIQICELKFRIVTKRYIQEQDGVVYANPNTFSRIGLINAFFDFLKSLSEIFGRNEWRRDSYNYAEIRRFFLENISIKIVIKDAIETVDSLFQVLSENVADTEDPQIIHANEDFTGSGDHDELLSCINNQINSMNLTYVYVNSIRFNWKYSQSDFNESKEDEMIIDLNDNSLTTLSNYQPLKHWEKHFVSTLFIFQIVLLYFNQVRKFCNDHNMADPTALTRIYYLAVKPME